MRMRVLVLVMMTQKREDTEGTHIYLFIEDIYEGSKAKRRLFTRKFGLL